MLRGSETAGPGGANRITGRWLFRALQFQVNHTVAQAPNHPLPIKTPAAPPSGFNAAWSGATTTVGRAD